MRSNRTLFDGTTSYRERGFDVVIEIMPIVSLNRNALVAFSTEVARILVVKYTYWQGSTG
jgi:hypothetical protein